MSSYQDELTLSVNLYGSAGDRARILSFFEDTEAEFACLTPFAHQAAQAEIH